MPHSTGKKGSSSSASQSIAGVKTLSPWTLIDDISCPNEDQPSQARAIVYRAFENGSAWDPWPILMSRNGPWQLVNIPFCTEVNLTEIHIVTGDSNLAPEKMQLYADDRHLTKADVDAGQPTETFTLRKTKRVQVLKLTASKFRNVRVLSIYFPVHSSQSQENIWMIYLSPEGRPANPNACPAPPPTTHDYGADY